MLGGWLLRAAPSLMVLPPRPVWPVGEAVVTPFGPAHVYALLAGKRIARPAGFEDGRRIPRVGTGTGLCAAGEPPLMFDAPINSLGYV